MKKRSLIGLLAAVALAFVPAFMAPAKSKFAQSVAYSLTALGAVLPPKFKPFAVKLALADGTEVDATVAPTDAPATDPAAEIAAVKDQVATLSTTVTGLDQRLTKVEAAVTADAAEDVADTADTPPPMKAMRGIHRNNRALSARIKALEDDTTLKTVANRMGIAYAARSGATVLPGAAGGAGEGTKHVFDQYHAAEGAEKTRLLRAHREEIRAEGERRAKAG